MDRNTLTIYLKFILSFIYLNSKDFVFFFKLKFFLMNTLDSFIIVKVMNKFINISSNQSTNISFKM